MPPQNCKEIFDEMPTRFNPASAVGWNTTIQFKISGDKGGDFILKVADGNCTVTQGVDPSPSATLITSDDTWMGIVMGTTNPMTAFTLGQLKVQGNMGDVMKLQSMIKQ